MQSYQIERASLENVEQIVPLFNEYRVFYDQLSDIEGARSFLKERLSLDESVILLAVKVGAEGKQAAGFTQLYPSFSSVTMQRLWILNDLFVTSSSRGNGIGSLLLNAAREWAMKTGTKGITLSTMKNNFGAQRLYEASGYVKEEQMFNYDLIF